MDNLFLSLIYPDEETLAAHASGRAVPNISEDVCNELGLTAMLDLKNSNLCDFFTTDPAVIDYRGGIFEDMMAIPAIRESLGRAIPILCDILELRRLDRDRNASGDSYLYSITEIELYISCMDVLRDGLLPVESQMKSRGFRALASRVRELTESDYYKDLNQKLSELSSRIHEVKSITVGVNLDAQLRPCDAGVISINSESFRAGGVLDKILRLSFKNDSFTCIADIVPFGKGENENRREALNNAFHSAIDEVFRSSVRAWRQIVGEYVLENTDFLLRILPEIEFVTRATDLMNRLRDRGCALVRPVVRPMEEKAFRAHGLYNPSVALQIDDEIVSNDLAFDDDAHIYVLTGPNRGGKSVITCALGLAQAMMELGMYLPADDVEISPADAIFTHFPEGAEDTIDKGRLGEECARLREIFDGVTENSMILLDESLSSTGAYEASYIASEILSAFCVVGCRGIFSTHLHDLASQVDAINARSREMGGVAVDTLVAGIEEGKRSFKIRRQKPDGKSYARDITNKYGLSFDDLVRKIGK